jgi:hypothetical protein
MATRLARVAGRIATTAVTHFALIHPDGWTAAYGLPCIPILVGIHNPVKRLPTRGAVLSPFGPGGRQFIRLGHPGTASNGIHTLDGRMN